MRHQPSAAWLELGNHLPEELNLLATEARARDRRAHQERKAAPAAVPVRRVVAEEYFAKMHAVVDAGGEA